MGPGADRHAKLLINQAVEGSLLGAFSQSRAVRSVPDTAQLHKTVYERLSLPRVRNFTSYGPYRPAALKDHNEAKKFYKGGKVNPSDN